MKQQNAIVFHEIREKFGLLGMLPFYIRLLVEQKALKKNHPEAYKETLALGKEAAKELPMLIAMFNILARKEGKEEAYEFVKGIFQKVAVYSMPVLYQIDDLVRCEGDTFDNFVKFNIAFFNAMNEAGTWKVKETREEKDKLTIIVDECANCVPGTAFG